MKLGYRIATMLFLAAFAAISYAQPRYVLAPESAIRIDGSSTVNQFSCIALKVEGFGAQGGISSAGVRYGARAQVSVLVSRLDCGNGRMNRDMYEAMKADSFPQIRYELISAELIAPPDSINPFWELQTTGNLSIAGVTRSVDAIATARGIDSGAFRVEGSIHLSMRDYNIDPPSAFFGLIKARDSIVVHFDLFAGPAERDSAENALDGK
ncbi:MAG TPA: YceI family protein [Bacteroidota bacterium]|nr:YceI family protein [Bacteroidota bacterium]